MLSSRISTLARRFFIVLAASILLFQATSLRTYAMSPEQKRIFQKGINYYDVDACGSLAESATEDSGTVDGSLKDLAKEILDNDNVVYWNVNGINTRDVMVALSEGKKAPTTAPNAGQPNAELNPNILKFILAAGKKGKIHVNALTDRDHSDGSNHYKGLAVDLDSNSANTVVPVGELISIASEYGGVKNNEAHHHFDFLERPKATPEEPEGGDTAGGSAVYMLGDSITVGAKNELESEFNTKKIKPYINASGTRSITGAGVTTGFKTSGLEAVRGDKARIDKAGSVVVALGTNQNNNFEESIKDLVKEIKAADTDKSGLEIFWVNIFSKGGSNGYGRVDRERINASIEKLSTDLNYSVIDTTKADIPLSDSVHPTSEGSKTFAKTVVGDLGEGESTDQSEGTGGCKCGGESGDVNLVGSENAEKTWNYFIDKGLSPAQVAGIMGNLETESTFNPLAIQGGGNSKNPNDGNPGWGLIQWSPGSKIIGLAEQAGLTGPIYELSTQLELTWHHMNNDPVVTQPFDLNHFKSLGTPLEAAVYFGEKIEGFGIAGDRFTGLEKWLVKYGSNGGGGTSNSEETSCSEDSSGEVTGEYSLPHARKWYKNHPEYFTGPHHGDPNDPGVDIAVPGGTPTFSITAGKIIEAPYDGGYGFGVLIEAPDGVQYVYGHGSDGGSVKGAKKGDTVKPGQLIMHVNDTGSSRGNHLHLSILVKGAEVCPQKFLVSIAEGKPLDPKSLPSSGCTPV